MNKRSIRTYVGTAIVLVVVFGSVGLAQAATYPKYAPRVAGFDHTSDVGGPTPYMLSAQLARTGGLPKDHPIRWGLKQYQYALVRFGYPMPGAELGAFTSVTRKFISDFQVKHGLPNTGVIGYPTAEALLMPTIRSQANSVGMDHRILLCQLQLESNLDAGAVGKNGLDVGVAQISFPSNPDVSVTQAWNAEYSIRYMARRDAAAYKRYKNWNIAVVDLQQSQAGA